MMARFTRSRRQSLFAALATLVLILTACSSEDTSTDPPGNGSDAPPQEELEPVVIRFVGDFPPPPFNTAVSMEWFRDAIEERIPGSEVRLFFAGQLYNTGAEALEALASGNLELNYGQFGKDAPFEPAHGVISQPASLTTVGAIAKVGESEYGQFLAERMAALGVTTLATASTSFFLGYAGKCPHPSVPNDLRGLNVRTFEPIILPNVLPTWGASPIAMAFADVPSALETGVLDGIFTSVGGWLAVREQVPCYTSFGVGASGQDPYNITASSSWLDSLNASTRQVVIDTVVEMADISLHLTWCEDMRQVDRLGTTDVNESGFLIHPPEVTEIFFGPDVLGIRVIEALEAAVGPEVAPFVSQWFEEARRLSEENPPGSSKYEQDDCGPYVEMLEASAANN
jgi:TRAP-type C4-dicarboxylate transport system substrate-binding protein